MDDADAAHVAFLRAMDRVLHEPSGDAGSDGTVGAATASSASPPPSSRTSSATLSAGRGALFVLRDGSEVAGELAAVDSRLDFFAVRNLRTDLGLVERAVLRRSDLVAIRLGAVGESVEALQLSRRAK